VLTVQFPVTKIIGFVWCGMLKTLRGPVENKRKVEKKIPI
jgi:hypothetical protein